MKAKVTGKFRNDYPGKHCRDLRKLGGEIFGSLEQLVLDQIIKGYGNFRLANKKYKKKCFFGDWNVAKGKLVYKVSEGSEGQADLKIKFLAAYPFLALKWEKGYIQVKIDLYLNKWTSDEKIFEELKAKFYSFREEYTREKK